MSRTMVCNKKLNEDYLDDISQDEITDRNDIRAAGDLKKRFPVCVTFTLFLRRTYDDARSFSEDLSFFNKRCLRAIDNLPGIIDWQSDGFFYLEKKGDFEWIPFDYQEP